MAQAKTTKLFTTKGFSVVTPKGKSNWCKVAKPDTKFKKEVGEYSTQIIFHKEDPAFLAFLEKAEAVLDSVYNEVKANLGGLKAKDVTKRAIYSIVPDAEGNETDYVFLNFKRDASTIMDKDGKKVVIKNKILVFDSNNTQLSSIPLVGNDSEIRCAGFASPYYMASTKQCGITFKWDKLQIIKLNEYLESSSFDVVDGGYVASQQDNNTFSDESSDDDFNSQSTETVNDDEDSADY